MSNRRVVSALAVLAPMFVGMLFSLPAYADSQVRIVRLSYIGGAVQIDRATGAGFEKAIMNMPITQGVRLSSKTDSRAEVEFEDGSTIRLGPDSTVYFRELGLRDSGAKFTTVEVEDGIAYFNIKHNGNDEFRVAFERQEIELTHSVRFRVEMERKEVQLAVLKGELDLKGPAGEARVKKNETLTLDLNDPGRYELAKGVSPVSYDQWDAERDKYHDQYASARYSNNPYYYGRSDLNYYGAWSNVGGYGYVWRPYGVGFGWDPFYNGAWSWYPGGWTWVSSYPWGWTPYRYGSWVFISGYGWCWRPGGWNSWTRVPPVYNPPPAYKPPQPPPTTAGGTPATIIVNGGVPGSPGHPRRLPDPDSVLDRQRSPRRDGMLPSSGATAGSTTVIREGSAAPTAPATANPATAQPPPAPRVSPPAPRREREVQGRGRWVDQDAPPRPSRPATAPPQSSPPPARAPQPSVSSPPSAPPPRMSAPSAPSETPSRKAPSHQK